MALFPQHCLEAVSQIFRSRNLRWGVEISMLLPPGESASCRPCFPSAEHSGAVPTLKQHLCMAKAWRLWSSLGMTPHEAGAGTSGFPLLYWSLCEMHILIVRSIASGKARGHIIRENLNYIFHLFHFIATSNFWLLKMLSWRGWEYSLVSQVLMVQGPEFRSPEAM